MNHDNFTTWCLVATARIRFRPDRHAVYDELHAHLEDHRDALMEQGMDENEATQKALESMGSAQEIAPQLAAIHKPFWGYVCWITGFIAAFLLLCALLFTGISMANQTITREEPAYFTQSELPHSSRIYYDRPGQSVTSDGYLILVSKVAVWEPEYASDGDTLSAYVQVKVFRWPHLDRFDAMQHFYAADSLGTFYYSQANYSGIYESRISYANVAYLPMSQTYNLEISGIPLEGAEWLELHYDRDGRNIAIRIDLAGGD